MKVSVLPDAASRPAKSSFFIPSRFVFQPPFRGLNFLPPNSYSKSVVELWLPNAGAGTMSAATRVPSTYSWRTSASTPNLTHTTIGNNRFRYI